MQLIRIICIAIAIQGLGCDDHQSASVSQLIKTARSGMSIKVRQDACQELGEVGGDQAVQALVEFLDDDVLTYCASHGLGQLRDPSAVDPLLAYIKRGKGRPFMAVWALGEIRDPRALPLLIKMNEELDPSSDDKARLRQSLEEAISKIRAPGSG